MLNMVYLAHKHIHLNFGPKNRAVKLHITNALKNAPVTYVLNRPRVYKSYLIQVNNISIVDSGEKCGILYLGCKKKEFPYILDVSWCSEISKTDFLMAWLILFLYFLV